MQNDNYLGAKRGGIEGMSGFPKPLPQIGISLEYLCCEIARLRVTQCLTTANHSGIDKTITFHCSRPHSPRLPWLQGATSRCLVAPTSTQRDLCCRSDGRGRGCHESDERIVRIARRYHVIIQRQPKEVYILTNNRQRLSIWWKANMSYKDCKSRKKQLLDNL